MDDLQGGVADDGVLLCHGGEELRDVSELRDLVCEDGLGVEEADKTLCDELDDLLVHGVLRRLHEELVEQSREELPVGLRVRLEEGENNNDVNVNNGGEKKNARSKRSK